MTMEFHVVRVLGPIRRGVTASKVMVAMKDGVITLDIRRPIGIGKMSQSVCEAGDMPGGYLRAFNRVKLFPSVEHKSTVIREKRSPGIGA